MAPDPYSSAYKMAYTPYPYLKLNINGNALGNPGLAGVGGVLQDHWGR